MGKIGCYIIRSIGALIDWGIMFWTIEVHICVVVLDSSGCGEHGGCTGWTATGSWMTRDVLTVLKVRKQIEVESKDES